MKFLLLLIPIFTLASCATKETQLRMNTAQANALTCQQAVLKYKQTLASQKVVFTDERNALMYLMMKELANSKASGELDACDDIALAQIRGQAAKTSGLINGGVRLGGLGLGLWGVSILTNGVTDLANQNGASSTTYNNSRVVSGSGNGSVDTAISASGEGLGTLNNVGNPGNSQGGYLPRQINNSTDGVSNSGEENPSILPVP